MELSFVKSNVLSNGVNQGSNRTRLSGWFVTCQTYKHNREKLIVGVEFHTHQFTNFCEDALSQNSNLLICVRHGVDKLKDVVFQKRTNLFQGAVAVLNCELFQLVNVCLNKSESLLGWLSFHERSQFFVNFNKFLDTFS